MQRIKKGDEVIVISGRDRGKRGTVLRRVDAEHVVVEGVNRVKKHQRPNPMRGVTGGIVDKDLPIHVSNVALFNPATKKADRVGFKKLQEGGSGGKPRKVRIFKANDEQVDA
jgi:large subunit ribosomal protein L24